MRFKAWEIWLAYVKYEDRPEIKKRPVLIVPLEAGAFLMAKMTTAEPRDSYEHKIKEWKAAGLITETTIRTSKFLKLEDNDMHLKLGNLHPVDVTAFQTKLALYLQKK